MSFSGRILSSVQSRYLLSLLQIGEHCLWRNIFVQRSFQRQENQPELFQRDCLEKKEQKVLSLFLPYKEILEDAFLQKI